MKILFILLQFKRSSIENLANVYKEYLTDINRLAQNEKGKLEKMVKKLADENPSDTAEIYDYYSDQFGMYEEKYVELANNGLLVNAYSFFEFQLKDISRIIKDHLINKKGVYKYNKYFSYSENSKNEIYVLTGLDFTSLVPIWASLDKYREIRNCIVHNGANLIEKNGIALINQKKYTIIKSFPEIKINLENGDFYITDQEFVLKYLDFVNDYLKKLLDIIKSIPKKDIS